jgi:uncharacterized membrane protein YfcA
MVGAVLASYTLGPLDSRTLRALLRTVGILSIYLAARTVPAPTSPQPEPAVEDGRSDRNRGRNRLALVVIAIATGFALLWMWDQATVAPHPGNRLRFARSAKNSDPHEPVSPAT